MLKFVQESETQKGTRGSSQRARVRRIDARTGGRFTGYLIKMHAALDGTDFLTAAMQVIQAAAPGSMVTSKCHHLGVRGFRANGDGVDAETIEHCYREHPGLGLVPAHSRAKMVQCAGEPCSRGDCHHAVSLCFWKTTAGESLDCILSVHRGEADDPFTQTEVESLHQLHPQIDRARRRVRWIEAERSARNSLEVLVRKLPLAALVLDWELQPVFANAAGRECCARWTSGAGACCLKLDRDSPPVPGDLLGICHQMKSEWNGETQHMEPMEQPVLRELAPAGDVALVARISMIPLGGAHPGRPSFLLQFLSPAESAATVPMGGGGLAMLAELTPEERAVAHQIGEGKSNDEISVALGKSVHTVKRHIHSIFRKLRISNRTQLAMRLLA